MASMAFPINWGLFFEWLSFLLRALLFGVYIRAPDIWELTCRIKYS